MSDMEKMTFKNLVSGINTVNECLRESAACAINQHVTARNWLIGYYIVNYEQNGLDRAQYGESVLKNLSSCFNEDGLSYRNLRLYRQFYLTFPSLGNSVVAFIKSSNQIWQSPIAKLQSSDFQQEIIGQSLIAKSSSKSIYVPEDKLFNRLSYTHLLQLLPIEDPLERAFYEIECIKGVWSVRELQRQIKSNCFLRSGLSKCPDKLIALVNDSAERTDITDVIKSPYTFEFLGLPAKDVIEESELEKALMDHLQEFILELGQGFCFEARQKRILIDNNYFFYDLLFYNRLAHCGVIIELKTEALDYKDVAQINMYRNYYKENFMAPGDNPPIGILLCTKSGKEMVRYAMDGIDKNLFVQEYSLHLPSEEKLSEWLIDEIKNY